MLHEDLYKLLLVRCVFQGIEMLVELSSTKCPQSVSKKAAELLKLYADATTASAVNTGHCHCPCEVTVELLKLLLPSLCTKNLSVYAGHCSTYCYKIIKSLSAFASAYII